MHDDPRLEAGRLLLGRRLREARQRSGLNLRETSQATGLSISYLSDLERGSRLPSLPALLAVATAYRELPTDLLTGVYPFGAARRPRTIPDPVTDGRRRSTGS